MPRNKFFHVDFDNIADMSLIDQLIAELSKPPVVIRRRKIKYDENAERNIAVIS
jgi:hypothetical protein